MMRCFRPMLPIAIVGIAAILGLAGCGGAEPDTGAAGPAADPGFGHVHGLGVNPADGLLYAATHHGVWQVSTDGKPVRVADRYQDTMGFTITGPDQFLGSGHPDPREKLPSHLGLIESKDRARTWQPLSLLGQADFHALEAKHGHVYGYEATSNTFMVSANRRTWQRLARIGLIDFTVSPRQAGVVLGTVTRGLVRSSNGGETFTSVAGAPRLAYVEWIPAGLYGLDAAGTAWASIDEGVTWERRGDIGGKPAALTLSQTGQLFAANQEAIVTSRNGGRTFSPLVD